MEISQWELLDFLKANKRWFTTKELILAVDVVITTTEMVKFNRKLRQLEQAKFISHRVCERDVAWRHEFEYKSKK